MAPRAIAILVTAASAAAAAAHPPNPHFRGVGDLPGGAHASRALAVTYHRIGLPANITVVGESEGGAGVRAFRWTPATGILDLGVLEPGHSFSSARAVSWGATAIVGAS